jgi:hypothetical protein
MISNRLRAVQCELHQCEHQLKALLQSSDTLPKMKVDSLPTVDADSPPTTLHEIRFEVAFDLKLRTVNAVVTIKSDGTTLIDHFSNAPSHTHNVVDCPLETSVGYIRNINHRPKSQEYIYTKGDKTPIPETIMRGIQNTVKKIARFDSWCTITAYPFEIVLSPDLRYDMIPIIK